MLKIISTKQVRLGMFIQELKGAWIDHPFWKKAFKLEDSADLKSLQTSVIKQVVIDTSKGLDIEDAPSTPEMLIPATVENSADIIVAISHPSKSVLSKQVKTSAAEEQKHAKKVINASKKAVASMFHDARMGKAVDAEVVMQLVDEIAASVDRNLGALISLVRLKNKDEYTYMHSVAVCALMVALAKELNLSEAETKQAGLAGLLHDLGKAGIPIEVLNKPGALTDEEFTLVRLHPERGHAMLIQASIIDEVTLDVCLHHHEKMNGTGYPHKLKSEEISIFAKMAAVCDVYDAVTSNRPYKEGMAQWTEHFDDRVFKAFVKSVGIYPIGSMVKLKSGRLAVVVEQSQKSLLSPIIKVFFSTKSKSRIKIELIDLSKPHEQDSIVGHENPNAWGIVDINEIWRQYEIW
jgi:HD-GYP domain-containing protein (c-di-GMP phosphodiesterase class II)